MYKEKVAALMTMYKEDPDDLDFIESRVNMFRDYVDCINFMEVKMQRMRIEGVLGEEWRDEAQALDDRRRSKHEVAIAAVNQLNRLSVAKGLAPLYDGPTDDTHRTAVGDFCGQIMGEYFNDRYTQKLSVETLLGENEGEEFAATVAKLTEKAGLVQ